MPRTEIRAFRDVDGTVPILQWLQRLWITEPRARGKCVARIVELSEFGYEMRRPQADTLRDGIHELRASVAGKNYRILYFFHGKNAVTLSHGVLKERRVPPREIDLAIARMRLVRNDPDQYTADFTLP